MKKKRMRQTLMLRSFPIERARCDKRPHFFNELIRPSLFRYPGRIASNGNIEADRF